MESKETQILHAAEKMVRAGGYEGFSFRDIAQEVGIKSASVHYHFPTKPDLGAAVAQHYKDRFLALLGEPAALIAKNIDPIAHYVRTFTQGYIEEQQMCLCSLLGAQIKGLPDKVADQTRAFFKANLDWLTKAIAIQSGDNDPQQKAIRVFSMLEGAMIMSNSLDDLEPLKQIANSLGAKL